MTTEEQSRLIIAERDLLLENERLRNELEWARKALSDFHSGRVYSTLLECIDYWRARRDEALNITPPVLPHQVCPKCGGYEKGCEECRGTGEFKVWLEESKRNEENERIRGDAF